MSFAERRHQRLADRLTGPLDQGAAADLDVLTTWAAALAIPMTNPHGETPVVDAPSLVDPYEEGVDIYFTAMSLHSLDRAAALDDAGATLEDELLVETQFDDNLFALIRDLDRNELLARVTAVAEASAIPSFVPEADLELADAVSWTWAVIEDLSDRITTYLRSLTIYEWRDFAKLCGYVLALAPTAADTSADHTAQTPPDAGDARRALDSGFGPGVLNKPQRPTAQQPHESGATSLNASSHDARELEPPTTGTPSDQDNLEGKDD